VTRKEQHFHLTFEFAIAKSQSAKQIHLAKSGSSRIKKKLCETALSLSYQLFVKWSSLHLLKISGKLIDDFDEGLFL
jgi:hypothetical protein